MTDNKEEIIVETKEIRNDHVSEDKQDLKDEEDNTNKFKGIFSNDMSKKIQTEKKLIQDDSKNSNEVKQKLWQFGGKIESLAVKLKGWDRFGGECKFFIKKDRYFVDWCGSIASLICMVIFIYDIIHYMIYYSEKKYPDTMISGQYNNNFE